MYIVHVIMMYGRTCIIYCLRFYCYVFRCASEDKAYALALAVAKAFYLAYQVSYIYSLCTYCVNGMCGMDCAVWNMRYGLCSMEYEVWNVSSADPAGAARPVPTRAREGVSL